VEEGLQCVESRVERAWDGKRQSGNEWSQKGRR
jgi:hypothetical protein